MKFTRCGKICCRCLTRGADAQLRKIGNYKFENFEIIPSLTCTSVLVNSKIIQTGRFGDGGDIGHPISSVPVSGETV